MKVSTSTAYIAAATNRFPTAADVTADGTVIFGSSNLVAVWDISEGDKGISATIPGHLGTVTCIRVIDSNSFVSADDQGQVRIWKKTLSQACSTQYPINRRNNGIFSDDFISTGSSDATVKLWKLREDRTNVEEYQVISLSGRYPLSLAFAHLPQSTSIVLAIGGTDRDIQLWTWSENTFVRSASLSGHEDWIRGLAFYPLDGSGPLILASGSQDATVRLWNIEAFKKGSLSETSDGLSDDLLDAFEKSLGAVGDTEEGRQISLKRHVLSVKIGKENLFFSVTFDALLVGHEAGVTSVAWRPRTTGVSTSNLLSTSTDSSVIIWSPAPMPTNQDDRTSSIWINRQRFGDIGGQRLGGFVGGVWRPDGREVLAYGWSGGWRRWLCDALTDKNYNDEEVWQEVGAVGGHRGSVKSVNWSPSGSFLISSGTDQTTRIHGFIPPAASWYELARPQVHGYDLLGSIFLDELKFASIADEKVLRIFEAPRRFLDLMEALHVSNFPETEKHRPLGASVPPLGLSNRADANGSVTVVAPETRRAFEGELSAITLWPEIEKIFGHGYESITLACSDSREHIASACKASSPEHAIVRIYSTSTWQPFGEPLAGHTLTVTQIAFSPGDEFVLTVSRDRSWRLFQKTENGGYLPFAHESKSHARIIWDCVKIWGKSKGDSWRCISTLKMENAATAVDFTAFDQDKFVKDYLRYLAIGLENGTIVLFSGTRTNSWNVEHTISPEFTHIGPINRLRWRPEFTARSTRELASCGEDGTLRILTVQLTTD
ncbi:hypothetical protein D9757_000085 [Collybiopsis confluens]|uniref:Elongator complex protein 2 n=1 Tax=Collybiopsis confluens TaxID=2823264 RepID=A0A8H5MI39_9AGAR|nr:hypothetical protein D9757_000085 [Collybiopsis confluens]